MEMSKVNSMGFSRDNDNEDELLLASVRSHSRSSTFLPGLSTLPTHVQYLTFSQLCTLQIWRPPPPLTQFLRSSAAPTSSSLGN